MALAVDRLPTDPERLRAIIVEQAAALATRRQSSMRAISWWKS